MKLFPLLTNTVIAAALLSGCTSVDTITAINDQRLSSSEQPIAHLHATNWGLYLLPVIPLITGSREETGKTAFFTNTVNVESTVDILTRRSKELGATKTVDLTSHTTSTWLFPTLFFWLKGTEVSGNAIRNLPYR